MSRPHAANTSPEARRHERTRISLPARISSVDPDRNPRTGDAAFRFFEASTIDISEGGLAISAIEDLGSGRRVLIEVWLPDGRLVELSGRIVWLEPPRQPDLPARMGVALSDESLALAEQSLIVAERAKPAQR